MLTTDSRLSDDHFFSRFSAQKRLRLVSSLFSVVRGNLENINVRSFVVYPNTNTNEEGDLTPIALIIDFCL